LDDQVIACFKMTSKTPDMTVWDTIMHRIKNPEGEVNIAVIGKYTSLSDSYKSLNEALIHGGIAHNVRVNLKFIESTTFEGDNPADHLHDVHGILVPGGFGERGAQGKINAAKFARERKVPYFGICFGMQLAVIEASRNLLGLEKASSTEFGPCSEQVVGLMTEWVKGNEKEQRAANDDLGGTMRLGAYPAILKKGSKAAIAYAATEISERHRHRYEVNIAYKDRLEQQGLIFSGLSPDGKLPEIVEYADHPWFIGVQFHPELKSKPFDPHPLFVAFVGAAIQQSRIV
jgi:CTP synthase